MEMAKGNVYDAQCITLCLLALIPHGYRDSSGGKASGHQTNEMTNESQHPSGN